MLLPFGKTKKPDCSDETLWSLLEEKHPVETIVEQLLDCTYNCIHKFVLANSGTQNEVADVIQETAIVLLMKIRNGSLVPMPGLQYYVCRIGKNTWLNELRRRKRNSDGDNPLPEDLLKPDPDLYWLSFFSKETEDEESARIVMSCFRELGEKCKQLLWLHYVERLSWEQVAEIMGYNNALVARNQAIRCKQRLRECFLKNRYPNI